jgi:amino acid adenylation domain-containing protein
MKTLDRLLAELRQQGINLWVEGDRLRYRAAKDSFAPELLAEVKSRKVEIVDFLNQANESTSSQLPPIIPIDRNGPLPLSFAQQRLWFLHQLDPDSSSNNMPVVVRFTGSLNVPILKQSLHALVQRHEVLRTHFPAENGQPIQVIAADVELKLPIVDLRQIPADQRSSEALTLATEEAHCPFDLENGPILRLLLLQLSDDEHLLVWNMHCMICDGASSDVFYRDLTALYEAFSAGRPSPLPELPIQYVDFAQWQRQWFQGEVLETQLNYWKRKLEGTLPMIQLPIDRPRPPIVQTYRGDRGARMLSRSLNTDLQNLSQKLGATQFMTLIAAFELLLHRYSQQKDILISFASAGRAQVETEGLVGFFSNTLIQRINFDGNPTFRELLDKVRKASLEAYAHQDLPFEKLIKELDPDQGQSRSPLFQVKFALNPPWSSGRGMASVHLPDLTITSLFGYIYHGKTNYDLILVMREQDEGLGMVFDYNADLFDASTIARMLGHFETLLRGIVANPDQRISDLQLLTDEEERQLLQVLNTQDTFIRQTQNTSIHKCFEDQTERSPDAIAIVDKDKQFTYRELNDRANQLAHYLKSLGVKAETLVGLYLERSLEAILAILAVLKAGGIYVPLNREDSPYRLNLILKETQMSVLLMQGTIDEELNNYSTKFICLDNDSEIIRQQPQGNLSADPNTDDLAAILYPLSQVPQTKGVRLTHRGIIQQAKNTVYIEPNAEEVFMQIASFSSETALFEIWGSLLNGSKLVIFPGCSISPSLLGQAIRQHEATILSLPTRIFHRMADEQIEDLRSVRKLFARGDWLSPAHVQRFHQFSPKSSVYNVYSVTENAGFTCCYAAINTLPRHASIPIGQMPNHPPVYVLDRNQQLLPIGTVGELYIGGDRLAQGYNNRPELTEAAFIENPFSEEPNARLYKTGDLARWLPGETLELVSTIDDLIMIQGLPIEKGRISTVLYENPWVKESCVLAQQDETGTKKLVAYVVLHSEQLVTSNDLRKFLQKKLSDHMVPAAYVFLYAIPLNTNGEIDWDALPVPDLSKQLSDEFITPRDEVEQQLADIWKRLLGHSSISIHENFFALGGHSLLSVRMISEIEETFNYRLPLASFSQISTIAEIAQLIRGQGAEITSTDEPPPGLCLEDYRTLLSHSAGRAGRHIGKRGLVIETLPIEMKSSQPFIWIGDINVSKKLDLQQPIYTMPANSWQPIHSAENYISVIASLLIDELLTVQPKGPYTIGAYCFEGLVAIEMAHLLQQQGKEVALLALIDKYGPSSSHSLYRKLDNYLCVLRAELYKLLTLPISIPEKWQYIKKRLRRRDEFILNIPQQGEALIKHQTITMLDAAMNNYVPKPYSGKVILVKSTKTDLSIGTKDLFQFDIPWLFPYFGWENVLTGKVETYKMLCKHLEVYENPYIKELGAIIENALIKLDIYSQNN